MDSKRIGYKSNNGRKRRLATGGYPIPCSTAKAMQMYRRYVGNDDEFTLN